MKRSTFEIYRDSSLQFRWRFVASNGRILADSGEGYKRRRSAVAGILALERTIEAAPIVDVPLTDPQKRQIEADFKRKLAKACGRKG